MKRNLQHIIEEESRVNFAPLIPLEWVKNDFVKDYGKDIHVEIFDNSIATGKTFIVQLKGTASRIVNDTITIQLDTSVLQYYRELDTPILLVLYSTKKKAFWGVWANFLSELLEYKKEQKTITIRLTKENFIDSDYFLKLGKSFDSEIPYKINLHIESNGEFAEMLAKRYQAWCNFYFRPFYRIDDPAIPSKLSLTINEDDQAIHFQFLINEKKARVESINKLSDLSFLLHSVISDYEIAKEEAELLYLTSYVFMRFDPKNSFKLLIGLLHLYNGYHKTKETLAAIGINAIETNHVHELQQLIDIALTHSNYDDFQLLNAVLSKKENLLDYYQKNLQKAIDTTADDWIKSTFHYNLGNYYRYMDKHYLSVWHYMKAKRLNAEYLNQSYWWHELGGVLFRSNHFKLSEAFYRKSIALDSEKTHIPFTYSLLADALFHQTRFTEAKTNYEHFLKEVNAMGKTVLAYYAFKSQVCDQLTQSGHEHVTMDYRKTMDLYFEGVEKNDTDLLFEALSYHPLNHYAWFYLGVLYQGEKKYTIAYNCFLAAAVVMETDRNYWIECLVAANQIPSEDLCVSVFMVMVQHFGKTILNDISSAVFSKLDADLETKKNIIKFFTDLAQNLTRDFIDKTFMPPHNEYRLPIGWKAKREN